ncbi:hypothetical protein [Pseudomonas baltica]|uniref:hypothetical protein n=1 Tax=Pseudomonas baltica TaxID=2762576 RepID=UPI00289DEB33|nr:hypothetical protein [Pseudomonas baltica]
MAKRRPRAPRISRAQREAVVDLINLFRRELHKNEGQRVTWLSEEAADLASRLNLLGAVGLDVDMMYFMGVDAVMSLYEALTSGGRGGAIAHSIMTYDNPAELRQWFINATPAALGPMLMTLIREPNAFQAINDSTGEKITYDRGQAYLLQQTAISRIVKWIYDSSTESNSLSNAQMQFTDACARMNKFGESPKTPGQYYCENRYDLDVFMSVPVLQLERKDGNLYRSQYKSAASKLGEQYEGHCKIIPREILKKTS